MKRILLMVLLVVLSFSVLSADVYLKTRTQTSAFEMMGQKQEAKDELGEQWFSKNRMAMITPGTKILLDGQKNTMTMINHNDKTYVQADLPLDMTSLLPPEAAAMMGMMKMKVSVSPNGQSKKIGSWNCKGYDVKMEMMMMNMNMTIWASNEVPFDWKSYQKLALNLIKLQGQMFDEASMQEFLKIDGVQIASEMKMEMMGSEMKTTTEVIEISEKTPPADLYVVPADYKKIDFLSLNPQR